MALGFDPSYNGESGGEPRHVTSPELTAEDFSAGVDFLGTLPPVDREHIGAIGICASGGFALSAAQVDTRIKAVPTASTSCCTTAAPGRRREEATKATPPRPNVWRRSTQRRRLRHQP